MVWGLQCNTTLQCFLQWHPHKEHYRMEAAPNPKSSLGTPSSVWMPLQSSSYSSRCLSKHHHLHHKCPQLPTWDNKFRVACHLLGIKERGAFGAEGAALGSSNI